MRFFLILIFSFNYFVLSAQDTLTFMSYNILNYPASNASKADTLKTIINHVNPDVFMITELTSGSGATTILNDALNVNGITSYQKATYYDGPFTDNMLFYNSDKLVLYSQQEIPTNLRNVSEYVLYYNAPMTAQSDTVFIYCYVAHLKAGFGASEEQQRNQAAVILKNHLDTRPNLENVILGGDFNVYSSSEPAYNTILNGGNISLLDPINTPGSWNNNSSFAAVHTQSTRFNSIGDGGAFGGLDDRFDFIFYNNDLPNGSNGLTYLANSYTALGNDGNHYNSSINFGPTNTSAPQNVIDALYYMSDHLPIVMKAYVDPNVSVNEVRNDNSWKGYFAQNQFNFSSSIMEKQLEIEVLDLLGKQVYSQSFRNQKRLVIALSGLRQGVYFVKVFNNINQKTFKLFKK